MKSEWGSENKELTHLYIYEQLKRMDRINEKKWKFVAIFSALCLSFTLMLLAYTINLPKTVPLVIAVNDFGEAKYMGAADKLSYSGMKVPEKVIKNVIEKFVNNKFSLSSDGIICQKNIKSNYMFLTKEASEKYSQELQEKNPLNDFGNRIKLVEFESFLKLSDSSYQVDFSVTSNSMNFSDREKKVVRGVIQIQMMVPSEKERDFNPMGIYIKNYDFTEIKTGVNE